MNVRITRATVLEMCRAHAIPHVVQNLTLTEVYRADEVFCTGTMGELAPVLEIDGRPIGSGRVPPGRGPMTLRLSELYAQRTASEGTLVV